MANYSLNETQTTALLDAIAIIKLQPISKELGDSFTLPKDRESIENSLIEGIVDVSRPPIFDNIPVVTATLKSVLEEIEALLITSTSEKAEKYLEKVSQTLNLMGLTQESDMILDVRTAVTQKNEELKDRYKEVDMDLKLIEGIERSALEALIGAGFNSGLQVVKHDAKELSFLTGIQPEEVVIIQNYIRKVLETSKEK